MDLDVELVAVESLTPDPANARKHGKKNLETIAASLRDFGQRRPLVVWGDVVIAGNGTLEAAKTLGWTEVVITRVPRSWDYDRARAYALADNRSAELATWDAAVLTDHLLELDAVGWDVSDLGFEPLTPPTDDEDREIDEDPPEPPAEPITKPGDLWLMGEHRLLCGDSFDPLDVKRLLDGKRVAAVITDPPYAIFGSSTGIGSDIADDKMVRPFFESLARIITGVLPVFGHAYVFTDWRSWSALWEGTRRSGLVAKNMLVWDKGNQGMGNMYAQTHELVGFYVRQPKAMSLASSEQTGQRIVLGRSNVLRYNRVLGKEREHNAAKPVALLEELVANSTDPGDLVLDLFGGSGSTMIAANNLGRRCYLMEMEPKFCDVIVARWERLTGLHAERVKAEEQPEVDEDASLDG